MRVTLHLESRAADVDRWRRGSISARVVKSNHGRSVWFVPLGSPGLYVKRFPLELFRDRARKEADLLRALEQAGIPCPRLVALARDKEGSYILTEEIPDSRPLNEVLPETGPQAGRLLVELGRLARKLHDAGFEHQDFHAGNVLVRNQKLYVIDVHRAARSRSLSRDRRLDGVAFTAMSFVESRPRTDILRFLLAYGLRDPKDLADVWGRLRKRRHQYYLGRQKRAFKEGTGFGVEGALHFRKGVDLETILRQVREGARVVIRETKSECLHRAGADLFVKTTTPARARRIWENAHSLALRGIDTPRLWAWERRWVAGEWVESVDLPGYILGSYGTLPRAERRNFLSRLARRVRRLHDYGVYHADLKAGNILVGDARILVIDLDRLRFFVDVPERHRIFNLAQLNASVTPPLTRTDRLRFLDQYIGNCASLRERRRQWILEIMKATVGRRHRWPAATESPSRAANGT